jgi:hypothetical protein
MQKLEITVFMIVYNDAKFISRPLCDENLSLKKGMIKCGDLLNAFLKSI